MALGLRPEIRQSQQLVMTPQLRQAIRLLQMSNVELGAFLADEAERNPLLRLEEAGSEGADAGPAESQREDPEGPLDAWLGREEAGGLGAGTFDTGTENLYDAGAGEAGGEAGSWAGVGAGVGAGGKQDFEGPGPEADQPDRPPSLRAHLLAQIGQCRAEPGIAALARILVEELDEDGYLRAELGALAGRLGAAPEAVQAALGLVQGCEPTGVGARSLVECLALQLAERDRLDPAMRALLDHLELLGKGERRRLRALCGVDEEDFAGMLAELRALDPRPGARFRSERAETLIPDLILRRTPAGGWEIELNPETLPRVLVDRRYAVRLGAGDREARAFLAECRANAHWLERSLEQRARTMLAVGTEIVRRQERFFAEGIEGLRPLTLRAVAEATGLHESTVSRVTANKSMATERGILGLKFFFTNAIGEDGPAAETVRHRIRAMVEAEASGRILSDEAIVERLQGDGIGIARRTVAKYRKALGIPSSAERRRMKAALAEG